VQPGRVGEALFSVSADGTLVYLEATRPPDRTLVWVTPEGVVSETGLEARPFWNPRRSPRGDLIAVEISDGPNREIWTAATGRGTLDRLTFGRRANFTFPSAAFSPDGRRIAYAEDAEGGATIVIRPVDSTGSEQKVLSWRMPVSPSRWMPDGSALLLNTRGDTTGGDLLVSRLEAGLPPTTITDEPGNQWGAAPSVDGRYLVYVSDETGRFEVFAKPYPGNGPKRQLTTEGAPAVWA
jgi:Tol biopolymer transport system component